MRIRFLGTGGAFQVARGNSAVLVSLEQGNVLIDCGHAVFPKLVNTQLVNDVDAVLITHFHDDHVGSLSSLILYHQIVLKKGKLTLLTPSPEFEDQLKAFLSFSLGEPSQRVEFRSISTWPGIKAIDTFGHHVKGMQTWAYTIEEKGKSMAYSGDLGNPVPFFSALDQLQLPDPTVFHEVSFLKGGGGHTYYKNLEAYLPQYRIYGYHCDHLEKPADIKLPLVAESGFLIE